MISLVRILSFPLAAMAAGVAYAAINMISGADAVVFLPLAMFATAIAFAHTLVLGVPVALMLSRFGALTLAKTLTAAFIIGAIPLPFILLLDLDSFTMSNFAGVLLFALSCGGFGVFGGLVWWSLTRMTVMERIRDEGER